MSAHAPEAHSNFASRVEVRLPALYLFLALALTSLLALLTPPFFVPDEVTHAAREIQIGHGVLVGQRTPLGVGGYLDANAVAVMNAVGSIEIDSKRRQPALFHIPNGRIAESQLAPLRAVSWARTPAFISFQNTAVYPPLFYLPQAAGWRIAEAANLTIFHSLLLARFFAAFSAVAVGWLALRLCAAGRWLLFAWLLLPTQLALNASCSQDALLLPVSGLLFALLTRPVGARRLFTSAELVSAAALLAALVLARPPYLPLVLVLALPALTVPAASARRFLPALFAALAVAALLFSWELLVHPLGTFTHPLANPAAQMALLCAHPLQAALNIVLGSAFQIPLMALGGFEILGLLDILAPAAIYALLAAGFFVILRLAPPSGLHSARARGALVAALAATCAAISLVEYLIFTPPGLATVGGLQARYYLPLLALAFLLRRSSAAGPLRTKTRNDPADKPQTEPSAEPSASPRLLLLAAALFLAAVLYTPAVAAHGFYNLSLPAALQACLSR